MHRQIPLAIPLVVATIMLAVLVLGFIFLIRRTVKTIAISGATPRWWVSRTEILFRHGLWAWFLIDLPVRVGLSYAHIGSSVHWLLSIPLTLAVALPWTALRMRHAVAGPAEPDPSLVDMGGLTEDQRDKVRDMIGRIAPEQRVPPLPLWIDLAFALGCTLLGVGAAAGLSAVLHGAHVAPVESVGSALRGLCAGELWAIVHWIGIVAFSYLLLSVGSPAEKVHAPLASARPEHMAKIRDVTAWAVRMGYVFAASAAVFFTLIDFPIRVRHYLVFVDLFPALLIGPAVGYLWSGLQVRKAFALMDSLPPIPEPRDESEAWQAADRIREGHPITPLPAILNLAVLAGCVAIGEATARLIRSTWHIWGAVQTAGDPPILVAATVSLIAAASAYVLLGLHRSSVYNAGESRAAHPIIGCWLCHRYGVVSGLAALVPSAIILSPGAMFADPLVMGAIVLGWNAGKRWCDGRLRRAGLVLARPVRLSASTDDEPHTVAPMPAWLDALVIIACTAVGVLVALGVRVILARYGLFHARMHR